MEKNKETTLRTLKDLDIMFGKVHATFHFSNGGEVGVEELKAEAVNWIKFYETLGKVSALEIMERIEESLEKEGKQYFNNEEEMWMTAKIISFINFFNLTSEDLKNDK